MVKGKKYYQITNEETSMIINELLKLCETNPEDIAEYIAHNGGISGTIYDIKDYLEKINDLEKYKSEEQIIKGYEEGYNRKPTKQEIKERINSYQDEIDNQKDRLQNYLLSDSVFYGMKCKVSKFNDGESDKIFTPNQVELIYKTIENYVVANKKTKVLFANRENIDGCVEELDKKHLPVVLDWVFECCDLQKILKMYNDSLRRIYDIKFETKLKDLVITEGNSDDLYNYLLATTKSVCRYKNNSLYKQNKQEAADKLLEYIKANRDASTCRKILFSLDIEGKKSEGSARDVVNYFDKKGLLKMYFDFCSPKDIDNFVDQIQNNKARSDYPPLPREYDVELC